MATVVLTICTVRGIKTFCLAWLLYVNFTALIFVAEQSMPEIACRKQTILRLVALCHSRLTL